VNWNRMSFKGQDVWVKVDAGGRPVLDSQGRAEMKYRPDDSRSYRPSLDNLQPATGRSEAPAPRPAARAATRQRTRPGGPAASATGPEVIHVWTDGACTGNPGPMGIGVVVLAEGVREERGEYLGVGTNNIAELTAIERGLQVAGALAPEHNRPIRVYSDSAYSIGVISMGWKAKANQELVARLRRLVAEFPVLTFVKVAGHAGVPENERCDELARRAIETRASP
jgi:ribonuclease HI